MVFKRLHNKLSKFFSTIFREDADSFNFTNSGADFTNSSGTNRHIFCVDDKVISSFVEFI